MKTVIALSIALSLLGCEPRSASAGIADGLGKWEGSGTLVEASGKDLGGFTVSLTRRSLGAGKVRSDGRVTLADGQEIVFWQEFRDHGPNGFDLVSSNGSGGGQCFANGMCQSYERSSDGHDFATSIVKDGPDKVRIAVVELEGGNAVRFVQQTLLKQP